LILSSQNYDYSSHSGKRFDLYAIQMHSFEAASSAIEPLCLYQQTIPVYIVSKISQTYLGFGSHKSYSSYQQAAGFHCLNAKYMFDSATNLCSLMINCLLTLIQFLITTTLSLNMTAKTKLLKSIEFFTRTISRISEYITAAVILIKKLLENIAVMNRCRRYFIIANQLMLDICIYMILIAKSIFTILLYPACIGIFLTYLILGPVFRDIAILNIIVFLPAVTLLWGRYNTGINYLTLLCGKTVFIKKFIKLIKQLFDELRLCKLFSKPPYSLCIRNCVTNRKSQESHEAEPVSYLKFDLVIREIVQRLQYHYLEHNNKIERFSARIGFSFFVPYGFKRTEELFPIYYFVEFNKRVTAVIELFKTCLPVKKSCVHHLQSFASFMKNRNLIVNELNIFKGAINCT